MWLIMFKYRKITLYLITILYILFTLIEFIIYLSVYSNVFGLVYFIISSLIIFLLVPCAYNYKKYYSVARISKMIIIIVLGLFSSYLLFSIVSNSMSYIDSSILFNSKIKTIKMILKPILFFMMIILTFFETKGERIIKTISKKNID